MGCAGRVTAEADLASTSLDEDPRDAATVILLRDGPEGPSTFMVRRHGKSGFMGGAHVFPGGVLDPSDGDASVIARVEGLDEARAAALLGEADGPRSLALHVAAIRETFEEAGVLLSGDVEGPELAPVRDRLNAGEDFGALLDELDCRLRADLLAPWARWVTPTIEPRRYDARFFVARIPEGQRASHDSLELTQGYWGRPIEVMDSYARGELVLPPPTLRTLEEMAGLQSVDAIFAHARSRKPPFVRPHFHQKDDLIALTLPGDPAHPEPEPVIFGTTRFAMRDGRFQSV